MSLELFVVAGYSAEGDELARWEIRAKTPADACYFAEELHEEGRTPRIEGVDEYQAVLRGLTNDEVIRENYRTVEGQIECSNCGDVVPMAWTQHDDDVDLQCLPCVHAGLEHGRKHVAEAFWDELDPSCGYCGTTGHRASDCLERPA